MNSYKIEILPAAIKEYKSVPCTQRELLKRAILALESEPRGRQVKKLKSCPYYRLRVGDWRVIFAISDVLKLVTIIAIERRTTATYH